MSVDADREVMVPCCRKPSTDFKTLQGEWCLAMGQGNP